MKRRRTQRPLLSQRWDMDRTGKTQKITLMKMIFQKDITMKRIRKHMTLTIQVALSQTMTLIY
jgi:hypothetical protein